MADGFVSIAPLGQAGIAVRVVWEDQRAGGDCRGEQGRDQHLFAVGKPLDDHCSGALEHAEDRRLLFRQRAPSPCPLQSVAASGPPFFFTASGCPFWPATT